MPLKTSTAVKPALAAVEMGPEWLLARWREMQRIRRAEEAIGDMVESGEARCPCHLYIGQEAIASGVCAALTAADTVWGGHRSHGHYLAKGGSLTGLFSEVLGKVTGCSSGRGGSMHLLAAEVGILGTVPIVAGTVPLAAGAALASKMRRDGTVAVAFFGDGTLEEGHVHETLNLAAVYRLPLVFVVENNLYSSHLHWSDRRVTDNLDEAGEFHGVPGMRVDGNDVTAVYQATRAAVGRAKAGLGPTLLECRTFRWRGHVGASSDLDVGVHRKGELAEWLEKDPLARVAEQLSDGELAAASAEIEAEIAAALLSARKALLPLGSRVSHHVWEENIVAPIQAFETARPATSTESIQEKEVVCVN
jgi:acetoin:2,6-dichlorophenolindophenol oxidoreductase subunit alpha